MKLTKKGLVIIIISAVIIGAFGIYRFLYGPVIKGLKAKYSECKGYEAEVLYARNLIESVNIMGTKSPLLTEEDIALAIDELTKRGKSTGINFVSITPKEAARKKEKKYQILPIEMEVESGYEELGTFLGSLDKMQNSLITVSSFEVYPSLSKDPRQLQTELVIYMHLLSEEGR